MIPDKKIDMIKGHILRFYWAPVFLMYLTVRLFSGYRTYLLAGDQCKYLIMGRNFPFHTVFNHALYLIHPPLYGYVIGLVDFLFPLVLAGLLATIIPSALLFFVFIKLARLYKLKTPGILVGLIFLSLNTIAVVFDTHISRVALLQLLIAMSLVSFKQFLVEDSGKFPFGCLVMVSLCMATSDQSLMLYPCLALLFLGSGQITRKWKTVLCIFAVSGAIYGLWPLTRLIIYLSHDYYPAGIAGMIGPVGKFSLKAILQPNYLPITEFQRSHFTPTSFSLQNVSIVGVFSILGQLLYSPGPGLTAGVVSVLILTCTALAIWNRTWDFVILLGVSCILYTPNIFGMNVWYGIGVLITIPIVLGRAVDYLTARFKNKATYPAIITAAVISICVTIHWTCAEHKLADPIFNPAGGPWFLLTRRTFTPGYKLSSYLPADTDIGIMAPSDLTQEFAYQTGHRYIALPLFPTVLDKCIKDFKITYLLFPDRFISVGPIPEDTYYYAKSIHICTYINAQPGKYRLSASWTEDWNGRIVTMLLYKVKTTAGH